MPMPMPMPRTHPYALHRDPLRAAFGSADVAQPASAYPMDLDQGSGEGAGAVDSGTGGPVGEGGVHGVPQAYQKGSKSTEGREGRGLGLLGHMGGRAGGHGLGVEDCPEWESGLPLAHHDSAPEIVQALHQLHQHKHQHTHQDQGQDAHQHPLQHQKRQRYEQVGNEHPYGGETGMGSVPGEDFTCDVPDLRHPSPSERSRHLMAGKKSTSLSTSPATSMATSPHRWAMGGSGLRHTLSSPGLGGGAADVARPSNGHAHEPASASTPPGPWAASSPEDAPGTPPVHHALSTGDEREGTLGTEAAHPRVHGEGKGTHAAAEEGVSQLAQAGSPDSGARLAQAGNPDRVAAGDGAEGEEDGEMVEVPLQGEVGADHAEDVAECGDSLADLEEEVEEMGQCWDPAPIS